MNAQALQQQHHVGQVGALDLGGGVVVHLVLQGDDTNMLKGTRVLQTAETNTCSMHATIQIESWGRGAVML